MEEGTASAQCMTTLATGTMSMLMAAELAAACAAVRAGARAAARVQQGALGTISKQDTSPVTVADFAVQAIVFFSLRANLPAASLPLRLMAEEDADTFKSGGAALAEAVTRVVNSVLLRPSGPQQQWSSDDVAEALGAGTFSGGDMSPYWILDPIDGTRGFIRGGQYCVGLAKSEAGAPVLGVLGCPSLGHPTLKGEPGTLFYAVRGRGAFQEPLFDEGPEHLIKSLCIRVSDASTTSAAVVCESFEAGHSDHALSSRISATLGITAPPLQLDSMCKYGLLARGEASVYLRFPRPGYQECVWDHAAGGVILEEAGGRVTDAEGKLLVYGGRKLVGNVGVIATNGLIHDSVLAAYRSQSQKT